MGWVFLGWGETLWGGGGGVMRYLASTWVYEFIKKLEIKQHASLLAAWLWARVDRREGSSVAAAAGPVVDEQTFVEGYIHIHIHIQL